MPRARADDRQRVGGGRRVRRACARLRQTDHARPHRALAEINHSFEMLASLYQRAEVARRAASRSITSRRARYEQADTSARRARVPPDRDVEVEKSRRVASIGVHADPGVARDLMCCARDHARGPEPRTKADRRVQSARPARQIHLGPQGRRQSTARSPGPPGAPGEAQRPRGVPYGAPPVRRRGAEPCTRRRRIQKLHGMMRSRAEASRRSQAMYQRDAPSSPRPSATTAEALHCGARR